MKVLRISALDAIPIRQQMLLAGKSADSCFFPGDDDDNTFHLGAFVDGKLVSVASFFFENNEKIKDPYQFCLRGMATLPSYQNQGLSSELLKMAFPMIKQNQCTLLWCLARKSAQGYYEKVGFKKLEISSVFDEFGEHILMAKEIGL